MCMCGFERGGGTLGGLGDRDSEKGDRDGLAGVWLAGFPDHPDSAVRVRNDLLQSMDNGIFITIPN